MRVRKMLGVTGIGCALLVGYGSIRAQQPKTEGPVPALPKPAANAKGAAVVVPMANPEGTHELTAVDLEAYLDGMMPAQLAREDVAGATIAVVKDGHVLFAKGYGFADVENRKPVVADTTLFRPGSISKLFTWTSVMQLVEQGKLDLDKDINEYLDFKIPPAFDKPITLRNVMTHTPGFEESIKDLFVGNAQQMVPLEKYMKAHMPDRIYPPGTTPAYSNYATSIAGYIVQRVSGKPFEQYVHDNIYAPLGMNHTTFVQPLPADMQPNMSNGYSRASQKAQSFEFVQGFPAGSVATTATDMCKFMMAHLQDGQFNGAQILKPETAKLMHSAQIGPDPRLNKMALGFYEETQNGHRIIGHGGDTVYFHSDLHLILDADVGFFVSYNSAGRGEVSPRTLLFDGFLDRYFPYSVPPGETLSAEQKKQDAAAVAGLYISSRRPESSFMKVLSMAGQSKVYPNADGTISVDSFKDPNGQPKKYEEIGSLLYRQVHGQSHIAFSKNAEGRMEFAIDWPFFNWKRASMTDSRNFNLFVLISALVVIVLVLILWPVGAWARWHYGKKLELTPQHKRQRRVIRLACVLNLVFLLSLVLLISSLKGPADITDSINTKVILLQCLGWMAALGTLAAILSALKSWEEKTTWFWARLGNLAVALSCLGLFWFAIHWNLMNFRLNF
ncbi:MAG TPA: serine hydrolase domain-containing protein [Candidatus Saccharimonadales bacterium]|nr:serine hydrolase domain-containing protein [Candidatus Saccharimonadales bacterium]